MLFCIFRFEFGLECGLMMTYVILSTTRAL
jgi:hypothetical protein